MTGCVWPAAPTRGDAAAPAARVLLVDDEPTVRSEIAHLLREEGLDVVGIAEGGDEGMALVASLAPDVLVADLRMAGMGGLELARSARRLQPRIGVVLFTAYDDSGIRAASREAGVQRYVVKGCPAAELIEAIEEARAEAAWGGPHGAELPIAIAQGIPFHNA